MFSGWCPGVWSDWDTIRVAFESCTRWKFVSLACAYSKTYFATPLGFLMSGASPLWCLFWWCLRAQGSTCNFGLWSFSSMMICAVLGADLAHWAGLGVDLALLGVLGWVGRGIWPVGWVGRGFGSGGHAWVGRARSWLSVYGLHCTCLLHVLMMVFLIWLIYLRCLGSMLVSFWFSPLRTWGDGVQFDDIIFFQRGWNSTTN